MESYKLDTGKKYIKDIFSPECFYCIPEYQRPYVWSDDQVNSLLDDLKSAYDVDSKKEYFIGSMIWNTKQKKENEIEYVYQDILDGQQRFITFYLLHGVLRDRSFDKGLKNKVSDRLRQEKDVYDGIPERNRIVFEIRDDSNFLDKYLLSPDGTLSLAEISSSFENADSKSVKNMANSILIMHRWFDQKERDFESEELFQSFLGRFFAYISNRVLALYLATPDNLDDAYNLFTVLNSRGLQLQVSDILRAQNLRAIPDQDQRKRCAHQWSEFENSIGEPYRAFDDFLWALIFARMKYRSDDNQSLTKAFDFMYSKGYIEKGQSTFDFVGKYVSHYNSIVSTQDIDGENGALFRNIVYILNSVHGSQYLSPVMHYREVFGDYRILDFLIRVDNLLTALWLTGRRTIQTRFFIIMRKMEELIQDSGLFVDKQQVADKFLASECLDYGYDDKNASTALDIEEFFEALRKEEWGSFSGSKINKTRYLLLKLDLIHANVNSLLHFSRSNASVEHLLPRNPDPDIWTLPPEGVDDLVHCLGNLALIDRKKNSSLSNSNYDVKRDKYKSSIECRPHTNYMFLTYQSWNRETIMDNEHRVISLLRRYYECQTANEVRSLIAESK